VTVLPQKNADNASVATMLAHLPEDALIWFQGDPTKQTGTLRRFESPPLLPGVEYTYTVRVQWHENGIWVSQVHSFPIHAGDIHCIDVVPTESPAVGNSVAANLAKLSPEDRKAAEAQRFCAVQDGIRLGAMGVPVKVTVKGETVFLCCEGCADKAKDKAEQTLEKVKVLKAKPEAKAAP
jgi:uncharacterized protein (TIGR03000 family)